MVYCLIKGLFKGVFLYNVQTNNVRSFVTANKHVLSACSWNCRADPPATFLSKAVLWDDASQVMIGAGNMYIFNIGEENVAESQALNQLPRWEFFLGDRPHQQVDEDGNRPTIQQITLIENHAISGDLIVSREVTAVLYCTYSPVAILD